MKHSEKIKLANKLITPKERKAKKPLFQTAGWESRAKVKRLKENNKGKK